MHTSSDIGADNYYGASHKYGSLPPSMRKKNGDLYTNTASKLSAPINNSFKVNRDNAHFEMNQEEISGEYLLEVLKYPLNVEININTSLILQ